MKNLFNINNLKNKKHKWRKLILTLSLPLVLIPSTFAVANVNNPSTYSSSNNNLTTTSTQTVTPAYSDTTTTSITIYYYYYGPIQPIYFDIAQSREPTPTDTWISTTPQYNNNLQLNSYTFDHLTPSLLYFIFYSFDSSNQSENYNPFFCD